jgi:hypothetical protein
MFYTTKNIISDYLIKESERAVLLFGGDSRFKIQGFKDSRIQDSRWRRFLVG